MGTPLGGTIDAANPVCEGQITADTTSVQPIEASTGSSAAAAFLGGFNLAMWGTFAGTVLLEKTYDGGTTWITVARDVAGTQAVYTLAWTDDSINLTLCEVEPQVGWRLRCSAYTSGTLNYRLSQGGGVFFTGYPGIGGMV